MSKSGSFAFWSLELCGAWIKASSVVQIWDWLLFCKKMWQLHTKQSLYSIKQKFLARISWEKILPLSFNNSAKENFVIFLYRSSFPSLRWKYYFIFCGNSGGGVALKPTTRSSHWRWLTQSSLTNKILLIVWRCPKTDKYQVYNGVILAKTIS